MAYQRVSSADHDDAVQEARIAIWQTVEQRADEARSLSGLLTVVGRSAIADVARRKPMTGQDSRRGKTRDVLRYGAGVPLVSITQDDRVEDRTHEVELRVAVAAALAELKPWQRYYVVERFLNDRPVKDIAADLGMDVHNLFHAWTKRLKPRLAEALAPLAKGR